MDPQQVVAGDEQSEEHTNLINMGHRLEVVNKMVSDSLNRRPQHLDHEVVVVAVGKLKPVELIVEAYKHGHRHFGENYVNELQEKSNHILINQSCPDIKWHFIGHVQTNKVKKLLVGCPNLYMVHSVDSDKLADSFNKAWEIMLLSESLNILIQVNTSREPNKSGVMVEDAEGLLDHIISKCPQLSVKGLMTIGSFDHDPKSGPNPDFLTLINLRDNLEKKFKIPLELSMGMSNDFEHAIDLGTKYVRIGEKIFGPRNKPASTSH